MRHLADILRLSLPFLSHVGHFLVSDLDVENSQLATGGFPSLSKLRAVLGLLLVSGQEKSLICEASKVLENIFFLPGIFHLDFWRGGGEGGWRGRH